MAFKTQQEIYKHLAEGGKVVHDDGCVAGFIDGKISIGYCFDRPKEWSHYHEPLKLDFEATMEQLPSFGPIYPTGKDIGTALQQTVGKRFKVVMTEVVE